jgi:hypothetical protein
MAVPGAPKPLSVMGGPVFMPLLGITRKTHPRCPSGVSLKKCLFLKNPKNPLIFITSRYIMEIRKDTM